jgi:hypothetical protein
MMWYPQGIPWIPWLLVAMGAPGSMLHPTKEDTGGLWAVGSLRRVGEKILPRDTYWVQQMKEESYIFILIYINI